MTTACPHCGVVKKGLADHIRAKHPNVPPFTTKKIVGFAAGASPSLLAMAASVGDPKTLPGLVEVECPFCGEKVSQYRMPTHVKANHRWEAMDLAQETPQQGEARLDLRGGQRTTRVIGGKTYVQAQLECADCGAPMELRPNPFKEGTVRYYCAQAPAKCNGALGAHPDGRPLGTPATYEVRQMRMTAHSEFDALWGGPKPRFKSRQAAYAWLRETLGLSEEAGHIARFDKPLCLRLIRAIHDLEGDDLAVELGLEDPPPGPGPDFFDQL